MQELNHQILDGRLGLKSKENVVLNHEGGLDVGQGVDLNTTEMDQMPSTSGINTNINRPSQVMDNAQTSAMHASTSTSQPRQTTVSCTGTSERNTLRQPVPSKRNRAEAIHCSSVMHSGAVSSFGATGPGPSQIPESDAQTTSNAQALQRTGPIGRKRAYANTRPHLEEADSLIAHSLAKNSWKTYKTALE